MNISISLTPELVGLIRAKVETGRYSSTSEVVREALRMLERADQREQDEIERLRAAWRAGIASGDGGPWDVDALKAEGRDRLAGTQYGSKHGSD
jgi:antitoxin ParD1/3/4